MRLKTVFAALTLLAVFVVLFRNAPASGGPSIFQSVVGHSVSTTSWTTPALTTNAASGDLLVLAISYGSANCSVNTPTGWTLIGDKTLAPTYFEGMTIFTKTASGTGETGQVPVTLSTACTIGSVELDISGASSVDGFASSSVINGTTLTVTPGTPTSSNALPIAFYAQRAGWTWSNLNPNWAQQTSQAGGQPYQEAQYYTIATGTAQQASLTFTSGSTVAEAMNVEPATAPTPTPSPTATPIVGGWLCVSVSGSLAGCPNATPTPTPAPTPTPTSTPVPTPTPSPTPAPTTTPSPTPTVFPYAPSMIYVGTQGGGGGGNVCATNTFCITGAQVANLNVRYAEGGVSPTGNRDLCGTTGAYCHPVEYTKLNNVACSDYSTEPNLYNSLDGHDTLASDPGFIHNATPAPAPTPPYWASLRQGQYDALGSGSTCANNTKGVYFDPVNTNGYLQAGFNAYWFGNTYGAQNTSQFSIFDNQSLVDYSVEYGNNSFSALQNYTVNAAKFFALFPNYPIIINGGGFGGSFAVWNSFSGTHLAFACDNGVCNDWDDYCAYAGNLHGDQFERPSSAGHDGGTELAWNFPFILNTLSHIYSDTGCANVDPIFLDSTYSSNVGHTGNAGDSRFYRDDDLALRIFTEPGSYRGSKDERAAVNEQYGDCGGGCINQVTVFPENGLQFIPLDSGMGRYTGTVNDGNGCTDTTGSSPDYGGAMDFRVACDASLADVRGFAHAPVYARAGTCYKFGTSIGPCVALFNLAKGFESIQDSWCAIDGLTTGCSSYPYYWHYNGTGPEQYYEDNPASYAICGATATCNGSWGELPWNGTATLPYDSSQIALQPNTLGYCPGQLDSTSWNTSPSSTSPTYQVMDCFVLLLSQ